jgi:hypothetical protein
MPSFSATERRAQAVSWTLLARALGALATIAVGAIHLQQYYKLYSGVPTIGTLFVLNFIGATAIGLALLAPIERIAEVLVPLAALAGIGLSATSFVFLWISERTPLFGFKEPGFDPTAIAATRAFEVAGMALLGVFLITRHRQIRRDSS